MFALTEGQGRPVVLIHGYGLSGLTWRFVVPFLKDEFRCHVIDLPGFGNSREEEDFDYSLEGFASAVERYVLDNELSNVTLVGHSLGGTIAILSLLTGRPEYLSKIDGLCVLAGVCYPFELPFFISMARLPLMGVLIDFVPPKLLYRCVMRSNYFDARKISYQQIQAYAELMKNRHVRRAIVKTARSLDQDKMMPHVAKLSDIRKPVSIIWGRHDKIAPIKFGSRLHHDISHSTLEILENCGHLPQEECPADTAQIILRSCRTFSLGAR